MVLEVDPDGGPSNEGAHHAHALRHSGKEPVQIMGDHDLDCWTYVDAPTDGRVKSVAINEGDTVDPDSVVAVIVEETEAPRPKLTRE